MLACGRVQSAVAIVVASGQRPSVTCGWHRLFVVYASRRIFDLCVTGFWFLPVIRDNYVAP